MWGRGEERCVLGFVGKQEGKGPPAGPRHRWEDNFVMDVQEVVCGVWTGSSWLRIGTVGENL